MKGLPSLKLAQRLLRSSRPLRDRILGIAKRLEALNEYHPDQALRVATDIVMHSLKSSPRLD